MDGLLETVIIYPSLEVVSASGDAFSGTRATNVEHTRMLPVSQAPEHSLAQRNVTHI